MKFIRNLFLLAITVLLVMFGFAVKDGYDFYKSALNEKDLETAVSEVTEREHYTYYSEIPEIYFKALVAVEDRRYYTHNGFDIIGTARAIFNDLKAGEYLEGGSTISQQLAKNLYFPFDHTLKRKIAEIFMAMKIEREYSKEQILEYYVNIVYYGSGYYCIYDASQGYFNKIPANMNDYECTLLVGLPNAPSVYSLDVNPDLAHQRQEKVLSTMVECGFITEERAQEIVENKM